MVFILNADNIFISKEDCIIYLNLNPSGIAIAINLVPSGILILISSPVIGFKNC